MLRPAFFVVVLGFCLTACNKPPAKPAKTGSAADAPALMITAEDLVTISTNVLASGPVVTGTIQPERRADLRAELPSVVLQVLKDNGDSVKRGDLLVRLDATSIRDGQTSADEAARAAAQSFEQAEKQLQRQQTLRASGMVSAVGLDDAETRRNNAQSDLAGARARAVQARQQLQRTEVRAPFDGIVSERKVSAGDTAAVGKELVKVIDPNSMRFEGLVSADQIGDVKPGQKVSFRVNGQNQQDYDGIVKRVDPAANPTTRQVAVLVSFAGGSQPRVSGLYAEGRIETGNKAALVIPQASLVRSGDKAYAWRVKDGVISKVALTIGERDSKRGDYDVRSGLAEGDRVMRNPASSLIDGQKATLVKSAGNADLAIAPAAPTSGK
jgi:membrane fusion protein (multidrug efflux system)